MKAIVYRNYGSPEVLSVEDVPKPSPKSDELLIQVRAAEATKSDCEMRSFKFSVNWFWLPLRLALGLFKPRRKILGGYFSGIVEEVGSQVTRFKPGDEVFGSAGIAFGAYGEYVCVAQSATLSKRPANVSFEEAAATPLGGLNALHFMRLANIQPGEKVLINGAGGSIGIYALQIAKSFGARVTAVDKAEKAAMLRQIGADEFVDYQLTPLSQLNGVYDVVFDMVANSSYASCLRLLKENGRYLSGNPKLSRMLATLWTSKFSNRKAYFRFAGETVEELQMLKEMIEKGRIRPLVDQVFPMEQAAEAHRRVEAEQRNGSLIISLQ